MFIDIHVHTRATLGLPRWGKPAYATPEQLIERYDAIGVQRAVILPGGCSPECRYQIQSNEQVLDIAARYSDRFVPFMAVDPRELTNTADAPLGELMAFYKQRGCRGIGEVTANLPFDHPMVENLFAHAQEQQLPLTFHIGPQQGGCYGLVDDVGLPKLEGALAKFPELIFLGHSQPFWAEIGPVDADSRKGYPAGPIETEGRIFQLMRRYANLHGDLSAGSGNNAVARDEEVGPRFLEEFQDRLYFGTDICAPDTPTPLVDTLTKYRDEGKISETCFNKIARENAARLLGLNE